MSGVIDLYLAYRFLKNLVLPFNKWQAYTTGVIDADGGILVPKKSRSSEQNASFGYFDLISMNLKKLLGKLPGGKSAIASYAAVLLLLKEYDKAPVNEDIESDSIDQEWLEREFALCMEEVELMFEDEGAPTNSASSGEVAAIGVGPKGEAPGKKSILNKKPMKRFDDYLRGNV